MDEFKRTIQTLNEEISDRIEYLNFGGCGIFAKEAYHTLTRKGKRVKLFIQSFSADYQHENLSNRNKSEDSVPGHVILECEGVLFDGTNIHNHNCTPLKQIKINDLNFALQIYEGWNEVFDRKQMPEVRRILSKILN